MDTTAAGWVLPVLLVVVPLTLFLVALRRGPARRAARRVAWFASGLLLAAAALSPPVDAWAHHDARGHMTQHLLLGMYAPIALVMASPVAALLGVVPPRARHVTARVLRSRPLHVLSHPATAAVLHIGGLAALYLTPLYAATATHPLLHHLVHVHFVAAGCLFAWAVVGPDPAPARPGMRTRLVVLVVAGGVHAALAKLLYARAGELPVGAHQDVEQAQQAAQLMYYGGDVAEVALAVALFAWWARGRAHARRRVGSRRMPSEVLHAPA
ncbi:cytochrome c oxidase assembly protein [Sanguibacter suaedae]|uniref:Cytochrome c oxidase assembly protein n=1 Tax=Sanguibacter suaedae TaxID=2795737 RepID=A0A934I7J8_9MICO|nr:cytochrome c oxidase assembly protein [Sanguibacter suaedae]MBI9113437.1 cytochrome c oxidase assembly protein [Sanguibacter suaedae]